MTTKMNREAQEKTPKTSGFGGGNGENGIRTRGTGDTPYTGLANPKTQPKNVGGHAGRDAASAAVLPVFTPRLRELMAFLREFIATRGMSPTLREIGAGLGISHVTAAEHVEKLLRIGCLVRTGKGGAARSLSLPPEKGRTILPSLTPAQFKTLNFICSYIEATGQPPSLTAVAKFNGIKKSSTFQLLAAIADKGYIARTPRIKASISVLHAVPSVEGGGK